MFDRITFEKVGRKLSSMWSDREAKKEILMDAAVIAPYVVTDTLLYFVSYLNFLSHFSSDPTNPETDNWYTPAYYTGVSMSIVLGTSLLLAFSDTAGRMFKIHDNEYREAKNKVRRVVGIPGAATKVFLGDSSLYFYLTPLVNQQTAIGLTCFAGACGLPAIASFLWSNHNKGKDDTDKSNAVQHMTTRQNAIKYSKNGLAYFTSAFYAIDVGFVYFHSALNIPKNLGLIDHDISDYQNTTELAGYITIGIGTILESVAIYIAFARMNANMMGLIKEGHGEGTWHKIERSWAKKGLGGFAVLYKVFNTALSAYHFFDGKGLPMGANIPIVAYSSLAGILSQASLVVFDPIFEIKKPQPDQDNDESMDTFSSQSSDSHVVVEITENDNPEDHDEIDYAKYNKSMTLFSPQQKNGEKSESSKSESEEMRVMQLV